MDLLDVRILDVFILGPLDLYISTFLHGFLKLFMIYTGVTNILYNGHNYLHFNNYIDNHIKLFTTSNGKRQIHRMYNLLIMYPIYVYIILYTNLPYYLKVLLTCSAIAGILFNLYYLYKVDESSTLRGYPSNSVFHATDRIFI